MLFYQITFVKIIMKKTDFKCLPQNLPSKFSKFNFFALQWQVIYQDKIYFMFNFLKLSKWQVR